MPLDISTLEKVIGFLKKYWPYVSNIIKFRLTQSLQLELRRIAASVDEIQYNSTVVSDAKTVMGLV